MIFSEEYSKLKLDEFHTIRKNTGYYKVGQIIDVTTPKQSFKAEIIKVEPLKKREITEILAWNDADCKAKELIKMLEKWYGKKYDDYALIHMKKVK